MRTGQKSPKPPVKRPNHRAEVALASPPRAKATVAAHLKLSERDYLRVLDLLENPPVHPERLKRAARAGFTLGLRLTWKRHPPYRDRLPRIRIPRHHGADRRRIALEAAGHRPYNQPMKTTMTDLALKPAPRRTRAERLEARVTAEQKALVEHAAALQGRTVTDFVLTSIQDAARRAIEDHQRLDLSLKDRRAFVDALLHPRPVNDRLRDTVRRYRDMTGV
jgi:uncharacterized protein (DUF1778 family)